MHPDRKTGRLQFILVIIFIGIGIAISQALKNSYQPPAMHSPTNRVLMVETAEVSPQNLAAIFTTSGVVEARSSIQIVPEISGRVIDVHEAFFDGGAFAAGETLFTIDPRDFTQAVAQRQAEVDKLQAALDLSNAEVSAAVANWKRVNGDRAIPPLVAKEPQLKQAQAQLKAAEAQLQTAKLNLQRTQFSLPFNGRVLTSNVSAGQFITAGQSYGVVFDSNTLEVTASLEEQQLEWLINAEHPIISVYGNHLGRAFNYQGIVKRGAASLDPDTRFATVRFGIAQMDADLIPGVFAQIHVRGQQLQNVVELPSSSVQSQGIVWRVVDDRLVRWQPKVLYSHDDKVVVKADTTESFRVVTSRISGATEGMPVGVLP